MPNLYNAGQLATIIQNLAEFDKEDLGPDDDSQKSRIYTYMNIALMKLAKIANQVAYSDSVTLSADGDVTFQRSGQPITDMFEPSVVKGPNGKPIQKRTSEDAPKGWWRESDNLPIHIQGFGATPPLEAGEYTLKYIKYPKLVTILTDPVEFPPSGYDVLIKEVLSLIKYSKNSFSQAQYLDQQAKLGYNQVAQGAISARGTGSTGQPPSLADANVLKG